MQPEVEKTGAPAPEHAAPPAESEADAWAEVLRGWEDEARHRAYLARFADLEGLATAGGRYREVLRARPDDRVALRFRDEVIRRATLEGLAAVPRAAPAAARSWTALRVAAVVVVAGLAIAVAVLARELAALLGARP